MSIEIIAVIIFFVIMVIIVFLYRNSTLEKLPLLPGEEILFEEQGVEVSQAGAPQTAVFKNCMVRVTTRRIIIAQKVPMRKNYHVLRHVISYGAVDDETELDKSLRRGYLVMAQHLSELIYKDDGGEVLIRIPIPESLLTKGQYIEFRTTHVEDFRKLLQP